MEFGFAKDKDKNFIKELWAYSFTDSDEEVEYYFSNRYKKENNVVIRNKEEILSSAQLNPYMIVTGDYSRKTSYVVGVSTPAEHRGKGYVSSLLKESLNMMSKNGEDICLLMPIDTKIYDRYSFSNIADMDRYEIPLNRIDFPKSEYKIKKFEKVEQLSHLQEIYNFASKNWKNYIYRNDAYFKTMIQEAKKDKGEVFISYDGDSPISYMTFFPKTEIGEKGFVSEIHSKNIQGLRALFNVIKSHYTQMKKVSVDTPVNIMLGKVFKNDNMITMTRRPFMMARILNIKKTFEKLVSLKKFDFGEKLTINVEDKIVKSNNLIVCIDGNDLKFKKTNNTKTDITLDIGDLTSLITSYISGEEFLKYHEVSLDGEIKNSFINLFPKGTNYFNEYV